MEDLDWDVEADMERLQQDVVIQKALEEGMDLRAYACQLKDELVDYEKEALFEYENTVGDMMEMGQQVASCDAILGRMQEMLFGFQADLSGISDEIRTLQSSSTRMHISLHNRQEMSLYLSTFLQGISISKDIIHVINKGDINDQYLETLLILHKKLTSFSQLETQHVHGTKLTVQEIKAIHDILPELEKLKYRAVFKIKAYMISKLQTLKKNNTNIKMIQDSLVSKCKPCMNFLMHHGHETALEIQHVYVGQMNGILTNVFSEYSSGLMDLCVELCSQGDMIAIPSSSNKNVFTSKMEFSKKNDCCFSLGKRQKIVEEMDRPITLFVAQAEKQSFSFEVLFKSLHQHLMDSGTHEYFFLFDFFQKNPSELFMHLYAKTFSLCLQRLEDYLFHCYDAIGIFLLIRITQEQRVAMMKRRVPCLDSFFDRITCLLWPRFKSILDLHLNSLRSTSLKVHKNKTGADGCHVHYITRRYAELAASILSLCNTPSACTRDKHAEELILNQLALLRQEMVKVLIKMSSQLDIFKNQLIFLINNYDIVLVIFTERKVVGEENGKFEQLNKNTKRLYVEEELDAFFHDLITYVRPTLSVTVSTLPSTNHQAATPNEILEISAIVTHFAATWKISMDTIHKNILTSFSNFKNGTQILQEVLTQLLLYHTRLVDLIQTRIVSASNDNTILQDMVTTQELWTEIKKYCHSFDE